MRKRPQRKAPRVETAIPIRWGTTDECARAGRILNLSCYGCFIQAPVEPLHGETIYLRFGLPTGHFMSLQAGIVHYQRNLGFAVEFTQLSDEERETLAQLVEYYRQIGPDDPRHTLLLLDRYKAELRSFGESEATSETDL